MGAGMLPIALGFGADHSFRAPMAIGDRRPNVTGSIPANAFEVRLSDV
jgi:hypothetical protein